MKNCLKFWKAQRIHFINDRIKYKVMKFNIPRKLNNTLNSITVKA